MVNLLFACIGPLIKDRGGTRPIAEAKTISGYGLAEIPGYNLVMTIHEVKAPGSGFRHTRPGFLSMLWPNRDRLPNLG